MVVSIIDYSTFFGNADDSNTNKTVYWDSSKRVPSSARYKVKSSQANLVTGPQVLLRIKALMVG